MNNSHEREKLKKRGWVHEYIFMILTAVHTWNTDIVSFKQVRESSQLTFGYKGDAAVCLGVREAHAGKEERGRAGS